MAFDGTRSALVLFGGNGASGALGDTWERSGGVWNQKMVTGPSPRYLHAMAFESAAAVTALYGGLANSNFMSDLWEWNGTSWTLRTNTGPVGRDAHALAYDINHKRAVLFGGVPSSGGVLGDTWLYGGDPPTIIQPPSSQNLLVGTPFDISVVAGGTTPFTYQWRKNGINISGAVGSAFNIAAVSMGDSGRYDVLVTNFCGQTTSPPAILTVTVPCPADIAPQGGDHLVNVDDLLTVINSWGPCANCAGDINGNGTVNVDDLLAVINSWGPCP